MVKNKTKNVSLSTMLVTILTIITIVLGGMFLTNAISQNTNAPVDSTVRADGPTASGDVNYDDIDDWEYYGEGNYYHGDEKVLLIKDKSVVENDYCSDSDLPWIDESDPYYNLYDIEHVVFDFNENGTPSKVGDYVFAKLYNVDEIHLPEGITEIGYRAFLGTAEYAKIYLPKSLFIMEDWPFTDYMGDTISCTVYYEGIIDDWFVFLDNGDGGLQFLGETLLEEHYITIYDKNESELDPEDKELSDIYSFDDSTKVLTISDGRIIEHDWGDRCEHFEDLGFESVELAPGVEPTRLGSGVFGWCGELTGFDIPESVTSIGDDAFQYTGITSITISDSIESIGWRAFIGCWNLSSVTYEGSSEEWDALVEGKLGWKEGNRVSFGMFWNCADSMTVHCLEDDMYKVQTKLGYENFTWSEWSSEAPGSGSGSGEQGQGGQGGQEQQQEETPATGVEMNIGFAIASLALVSALFVVANKKRKEDR